MWPNRAFRGLFVVPEKLILRTFLVDKHVLVGHTIFAIGQLRYVVTAIDKFLAIRANAFESIREILNDIMYATAVSVENRRHSLDRVIVKGAVLKSLLHNALLASYSKLINL